MTDISTRNLDFDSPSGARNGFLATPAAPGGACLIIHEIFGAAPEIKRVTERLARAGFASLMPDLFGDRFKPLCIRRALSELPTGKGEFTDVLRAAADALAKESGVPRERVCVIGFCMGAGLALAIGNAFVAVSANYGDVPPTEVMRGIGPTIACFGGRDRAFRKSPVLLRERLSELDVLHEIHVFENAGHAFLADGHHPIASFFTRPMLGVDAERDAGDREAAWLKILAFLQTHAFRSEAEEH